MQIISHPPYDFLQWYRELCKISHRSQLSASEQTLVTGFRCFIKFSILKGVIGRLRYTKYWSWKFYLSPHFIVTIHTVITSFQVTLGVQVISPGSNLMERGKFKKRGDDIRFLLLFLFYFIFIIIYSTTVVPIFPFCPLPSLTIPHSHSPPPPHCPFLRVIHTCSLWRVLQFNTWKSYFGKRKPVVQGNAGKTSVLGEFQALIYNMSTI